MARPSTLVFVYNAQGGLLAGPVNALRRVFSPGSYPCNLSKVTHGLFGLKSEWWEYLKSLNVPLVFLHRNELEAKYGIKNLDLPGIFVPHGDKLRPWIDSDDINRCQDVADLKRLIERRISEVN